MFTREGTMACETLDGYNLAFNARERSWTFVPSAGIKLPPGAREGMPTPPAYFGCTIHPDGVPISSLDLKTFSAFHTNLGWLSQRDLRNSRVDEEAARAKSQTVQNERLRPQICYPDDPRYKDSERGKCFYTDVQPYALVPKSTKP
jgi:hypothetical protein